MKKLFALVAVLGLGLFTIGCGSTETTTPPATEPAAVEAGHEGEMPAEGTEGAAPVEGEAAAPAEGGEAAAPAEGTETP